MADGAVYEKLYLSADKTLISDKALGRFRGSLVNMYLSIISYLIVTIQISQESTLSMYCCSQILGNID